MYEGVPSEFMPEWYIHVDPKLPTEVQAAIAQRDLDNFALSCKNIQAAFGGFDHELFLLDDFTSVVMLKLYESKLELYGHDFGEGREIMMVCILEPSEQEFTIDAIEELVPQLCSRLNLSSRSNQNGITNA